MNAISRPSRSLPRVSRGTWGMLLAGTGAALCVFLGVAWAGQWAGAAHNDFGVLYLAEKLAAMGKLQAVYALHPLFPAETALAHRRMAIPFPYPPWTVALLAPFARLPFRTGYDVWTALNLACFALAAALALVRVPRAKRALAALLLTGCLPMLVSTVQGQNSGPTALALVLFLLAFDRGPLLLLPATFLLMLKPQLAVVALAIVLVRRRPRELLTAGSGAVAALLLGLAVEGPGNFPAFASALLRAAHFHSSFNFGPAHSYSLFAQAQAFLGFSSAATVAGVLLSLAVICAACTVRDRRIWLVVPVATVMVADHLPFHDLAILYAPLVTALAFANGYTLALVFIAPWIDPPLYAATHVHIVVVACAATLLTTTLEGGALAASLGKMRGQTLRRLDKVWKSSGRRQWASASESATPSKS